MITATLTTKGQTTVPRAIRDMLKLKPGDRMGFDVRDGRIELVRIPREEDDAVDWDPFVTFTEWDSEADRKAYADL